MLPDKQKGLEEEQAYSCKNKIAKCTETESAPLLFQYISSTALS